MPTGAFEDSVAQVTIEFPVRLKQKASHGFVVACEATN
jgi:hypothetical protein